jgi:hypothetical protein
MSLTITINSVLYDGELATILFKPDNSLDVINLGVVVLPYTFDPSFLTPPREIYGSYTILVDGSDCSKTLNVPRPTPTPTPTVTPTRTPTPTPTPTVTPTPTFDPCKVPTPTPTTTTTPTVTPTNTVTPTPTPTWNICITPLPPGFTPTPTPTTTPTNTPTPTITPTNTPTPTPTPTPVPEEPGIYYGKFSGTTITSGDVGNLTFEFTNDQTNDFLTFNFGGGYGYILIPISIPQPTGFRDSDGGCFGFNIPINTFGTIIIIDGNGFPITYNIYRTVFPIFGNLDCWLCN